MEQDWAAHRSREEDLRKDVNMTAAASPGWYDDPWFSGQRRYWTGTEWTSDVFVDAISSGAAGAVTRRGTYGNPPTTPAAVPPPPPEWGTQAVVAPPATPVYYEPAAALATPERSFPWRTTLISAAAVAVLAFTGWWVFHPREKAATAAPIPSASSTAPAPSASPTPAPTGSTAPSPNPSGSNAPTQSNGLENLVVRQQDVPVNYLVAPIQGGTQVTGEKTLDLCNATYPSEALRSDRLQVAAYNNTLDTQLSTEAVRYQSSDATAQAFDEVKAVAADCKEAGTTVTANADASWAKTAGVDRLAYTIASTDSTGKKSETLAVYLKRGPLFIGVYFPNPTGKQMPVEGKNTVPEIVKIFEERLLNPPTSSSGSSGGGGGGVPA